MTGGIHDIALHPQRIIPTEGGAVLHAMKAGDNTFCGFGEAYVSEITGGSIRAWKRHQRMTLNLVVVQGSVRFVIHDDRPGSPTQGRFHEVLLSRDKNHARLTVPPLLWLGFQGIAQPTSMLLNIANLEHDPEEVDREPMNHFRFDWHAT